MTDDKQPPQISWIHKPANRYALMMIVGIIGTASGVALSHGKICFLSLSLAFAPIIGLALILKYIFPNDHILEALTEEIQDQLQADIDEGVSRFCRFLDIGRIIMIIAIVLILLFFYFG